jgi:hypothetical protein
MNDDAQILRRAKEGLEAAQVAFEQLIARLMELSTQLNDALRRAGEAEQRSQADRLLNEELTAKAGRTDDLEQAAQDLLAAFDRLPVRMEEAGIKQMVIPPEIPLYGTHEWQAVVDAKHAFMRVLGRKESDAS